MPLAFSYRRFSTLEQRGNDSLRRQDASYTEVCKRNNLTPALSYFDEGRSAYKSGKQRDLQKFLDLVNGGQVEKGSWLVIESLDRLSRQGFRPTLRTLEQIIENGVTVATASPERVLTLKSLDDPMALVEVLLIASRAKEESDTKSRRCKDGWHAKLEHCKSNGQIATARGPYWLTLADGKWQVIPERVKVIKYIFSLAIKGLGQRAIAKRLNSEGVPTWREKREGRENSKWGWAYIRLILGDSRVIGVFSSKVGEIKEYYPRIIDDKTYLTVQALTAKRIRFRGNTTTKVSNLFSGLAWDKDTGSSMVHIKKGKEIGARWIPSKYELTKSTGAASFPYNVFEFHFLQFFEHLELDNVTNGSPDTDKQEKELSQVEIQIEKTRAAIETIGGDPIELNEAITKLKARRKGLVLSITETKTIRPDEALEQGQTIIERMGKAKGDQLIDLRLQLRESIRMLVDRIDCQIDREGWNTTITAEVKFRSGWVGTLTITVRRGIATRAFMDVLPPK